MSYIKKIQIFGERCSGTMFLESLLNNNLKEIELSKDFGWKHFFFKENEELDKTEYLFLIIYRNPLDWLRSINKKPHHTDISLKNLSFSEFIRKEWYCVWDEQAHVYKGNSLYKQEMFFERDPETNKKFKNVSKLRSSKIRNWRNLKKIVPHYCEFKYEYIKDNPKEFIKNIAFEFDLKKKFLFRSIKGYQGLGRRKYTYKNYDRISEEDLAFIKQELDLQLEKDIGYDLTL